MRLVELAPEHEAAFLAMVADYRENDTPFFENVYAAVRDAKSFRAFQSAAAKARQDWRPKAGQVSRTRYVLEGDDGVIYGNGVLRFPLDEDVIATGGNLLFDVPPSLRRRNFGAFTLNQLLFEAVRAGLARALVTCAPDNLPARKCIEKNRGTLEEKTAAHAAYWIRFR